MQVGDIDEVGQDIIAVETEQVIDVEDNRGDGSNEHHVVSQIMNRSRAAFGPYKSGDGSHKELDDHSCRAYQHAFPTIAERPAGGCIHVRRRREDHEHHTHDMDFAAEFSAEESV